MYVYTIDCFIYKDLNKASREKNRDKILSLGPYAAALNFIIRNCNKERMKKDKVFSEKYKDLTVYRGI